MENDPNSIQGLGALSNFEGIDLTTVDTNYPILATGMYPFTIAKAEVAKTKDKSGEMIVLECKTAIDATDKNGKAIPAGYKITHRIGLTPSRDDKGDWKRSPEMVLRDVASLLDAVFGEAARKRLNIATFEMASLHNTTFKAKTTIDPEKDGYPETARIARFIRKEEGDQQQASGDSQQGGGSIM